MRSFLLYYSYMAQPSFENEQDEQRNEDTQESLLEWQIPEYHKYPHGRRWYILAGLVVLFILVYSIWTRNYLFGVLTILTLLIIIMHEVKDPRMILFAVTDKGIIVDERLLPYVEVERFWFAKIPKSEDLYLYLDFKKLTRPRIAVPVEQERADVVRDVLAEFVEEDEAANDKVPLSDSLGRWFKI